MQNLEILGLKKKKKNYKINEFSELSHRCWLNINQKQIGFFCYLCILYIRTGHNENKIIFK